MKNIEFIARDDYFYNVAPKPFPARQFLPQWLKDMPKYYPNEKGEHKLRVINQTSTTTAKNCTPMLDSMTAGYIIPLWSDVIVESDPVSISWRISKPVMTYHGENGFTGLTVPDGYYDKVFKFNNAWDIRTPKGYSCLITDPVSNENSPFKAISAIIDTDVSRLSIIPPFWLREGFEGIVERGTPMVQVIPFKRDDWKSSFSHLKSGEYEMLEDAGFGATIRSHYKRFIWQKKKFV